METNMKKVEKFSQSITLKALIIGFLTLVLLIPSFMIQNLIHERQQRSVETIEKINAKWSFSQTICAPIISVPYTTTYVTTDMKVSNEHHTLYIVPEELNIETQLFPEEKYYGIYKTILYKSDIHISGHFALDDYLTMSGSTVHWNMARIHLGLSDLRGITNNVHFDIGGKQYEAEASTSSISFMRQELSILLDEDFSKKIDTKSVAFDCKLNLNGSSNMQFIPLGKTTKVHVTGDWDAPSYIGNFSPEKKEAEGFDATWNVLRYNRGIPDSWSDDKISGFYDSIFGVDLIDTVNHYQQNMRSAKYALMFIILTFVVFFFVEILTKKRIHPIQYLLVGIALILFYTLLLSISEQLNFGWAYLIASFATIAMITVYAHSIFKNTAQTATLATLLCLLYVFLYVVLQLEDIALLIGSIGLFVILGIIMYFSRKINWYKTEGE